MEREDLLLSFVNENISVEDQCKLILNITNASDENITLKNNKNMPAAKMPTLKNADDSDDAFRFYVYFDFGSAGGHLCSKSDYGNIVLNVDDPLWDVACMEDSDFLFYWIIAPKETMIFGPGESITIKIINIYTNNKEGLTPLHLYGIGDNTKIIFNLMIRKLNKPEIEYVSVKEHEFKDGDIVTIEWLIKNGEEGLTILDGSFVDYKGEKKEKIKKEKISYKLAHMNKANVSCEMEFNPFTLPHIVNFSYQQIDELIKDNSTHNRIVKTYFKIEWDVKNVEDIVITPDIGKVKSSDHILIDAEKLKHEYRIESLMSNNNIIILPHITIPQFEIFKATRTYNTRHPAYLNWKVIGADTCYLSMVGGFRDDIRFYRKVDSEEEKYYLDYDYYYIHVFKAYIIAVKHNIYFSRIEFLPHAGPEER